MSLPLISSRETVQLLPPKGWDFTHAWQAAEAFRAGKVFRAVSLPDRLDVTINEFTPGTEVELRYRLQDDKYMRSFYFLVPRREAVVS